MRRPIRIIATTTNNNLNKIFLIIYKYQSLNIFLNQLLNTTIHKEDKQVQDNAEDVLFNYMRIIKLAYLIVF